jgi:hypothetical protein
MINRLNFYKSIRADFGKLSTKQVEGFESILNEWDKSKYSDIRWLAYMLATVWHETAKTVQPIEEYGKGKSYKYGKKVKHSGVDYTTPDKLYYGRGFVQLTWYENYQLLGRLLNIDLLNQPELALQLDVATKILFEGMTKGSSSIGDFTGKCLEQYFNDKVEDPLGARKIINGSDKAELITIYYMIFKKALL